MKKYLRMSSTAVVIGTLRVKSFLASWTGCPYGGVTKLCNTFSGMGNYIPVSMVDTFV